MNRLVVISAITGVLLSLAIAFTILTLFPAGYQIKGEYGETKIVTISTTIKGNSLQAPIIVVNNVTSGYINQNSSIFKKIEIINAPTYIVNVSASLSSDYYVSNSNTSYEILLYNSSKYDNVFYIFPNFIEVQPNSTFTFELFFNMSYYILYNDSVYTYNVGNYINVVSVTPLNHTIDNFQVYEVTIKINNITPGTLIALPIWDTDGYEIQYILILVK